MQPAPSPSAGRGDAVLQPAYFTSVLYVQALRDDISTLIEHFRDKFISRDPTFSPFSAFKQLWALQGWKWLHFRVFDDRARETFLLVTVRLFLERIMDGDPLARTVGLFGAYTFYYTQLENTAPKLRHVNHIPLPIDHLKSLTSLPDSLSSQDLVPLRDPVLYITSTMVKNQVFYVLPPSDLGTENPRYLPREILVGDLGSPEPDIDGPKKKGRPSRRDKAKKARNALTGLTSRLDSTPSPAASSTEFPILADDLSEYQKDKAELIAALESSGEMEAVTEANIIILERMREAQAIQTPVEPHRSVGVERVERAVRELGNVGRNGVLGLLEGAGLDE